MTDDRGQKSEIREKLKNQLLMTLIQNWRQKMAYNILIVDDSIPMRAVIKKVVKASGFDVGQFFEAANGIEALKILNREWLDLVLTDYKIGRASCRERV